MDKDQNAVQKRKTITGKIVSAKMHNTVIVVVTRIYQHPVYKKAMKRTRRYAVHNTLEGVAVGDTVKIAEIRPMSKTKHFTVVERVQS